MKNKLIKLLPALLLGFGASAFAAPVTTIISDTFIGGNDNAVPARDSIFDVDRSGGADPFDVDRMEVTIDRAAGTLAVKIATQWYDPDPLGTSTGANPYGSGGSLLINNGDLFISTNGWAPFGAGPRHEQDDASNGEGWEYVFDTSTKNIYGGAFGVSLSDSEMAAIGVGPVGDDGLNNYRLNQETRRSGGGTQTGSGSVTWSLASDTSIAFIEYNLLLSDLGLSGNGPINLGFHWTMTCGNDVIEGGVDGGPGNEVPEPGIVLLFGLGLLGLGLRRHAS
jgi:PEP-CTERM motif